MFWFRKKEEKSEAYLSPKEKYVKLATKLKEDDILTGNYTYKVELEYKHPIYIESTAREIASEDENWEDFKISAENKLYRQGMEAFAGKKEVTTIEFLSLGEAYALIDGEGDEWCREVKRIEDEKEKRIWEESVAESDRQAQVAEDKLYSEKLKALLNIKPLDKDLQEDFKRANRMVEIGLTITKLTKELYKLKK